VFGLETKSLSTNNFYKQKLRLTVEEPVFIKNYISPHNQKDEKIVEPSVPEYNSPLLLVPKKSITDSEKNKWRQINKKQGRTL